MSGGVAVLPDSIDTAGNDYTVFNNNHTKGPSALFDILNGERERLIKEFLVVCHFGFFRKT